MAEQKKEFLSCRFVLNLMVILGFMFNYMLRVNVTIAIVDMIEPNRTALNLTANSSVLKSRVSEERFSWTESQKNDVLGLFFWGYVLTELPGGRLAEVVGARRVFGGGMLAASILTLLTPLVCHTNFYLLLFTRVLMGFFLGATWPAMPPMAAKWIPPLERSKFIANMMASALGAAITLQVSGLIISWMGWAAVFYITGVIGLLWSVTWFLVIYDSPADHPRISPEERLEIETAIREGDGDKNRKPTTVPWGRLLTSLPVWAIIVTHGMSVFGYFTISNQLPSYMERVLHFDIKKNGFLSSLPYIGKYAMALTSSYVADRILRSGKLSTTTTRKLLTVFALTPPAIFLLVLFFYGDIPVLAVALLTASLFCNGAVTGGYLTNGLDIAPNFSGTIMGAANTLSSFGGWLSTKIVALLTEKHNTFEQWRWVFMILVFTYASGAVWYALFGSGNRQAWNSVEAPLEDTQQELKLLKSNKKENEITMSS